MKNPDGSITEDRKESLTGVPLLKVLDVRRANEGIPLSNLSQLELREGDDRSHVEPFLKAYVEGTRSDTLDTISGLRVRSDAPGVAPQVSLTREALTKLESPYLHIPKGELDRQARSFIEQRFHQSASGLYVPESLQEEGDIVAPNPEQRIAMLQGLYTKEQVEILRELLDTGRIQEPTVVLDPEVEFARLKAQLDDQTKPHETYVSDSRKAEFARDDKALGRTGKVTRWNIGVGEGKQELSAPSGILRDLTANFNRTKKPGENVPTHSVYAGMQADAIKKGKPLDVVGWSPLRSDRSEDIIRRDDNYVSGGDFLVGLVRFVGNFPADCYNARLRSVLMAKKLNT